MSTSPDCAEVRIPAKFVGVNVPIRGDMLMPTLFNNLHCNPPQSTSELALPIKEKA